MARVYKPKYPKMRTVLGPDGYPVMVAKIATRGPNKGKRVEVPRREPVRNARGRVVYVESRKWAIEYTDIHDRRRTIGGYTDKLATKQKAAEIERHLARQREHIVGVDYEHTDKRAIVTSRIGWPIWTGPVGPMITPVSFAGGSIAYAAILDGTNFHRSRRAASLTGWLFNTAMGWANVLSTTTSRPQRRSVIGASLRDDSSATRWCASVRRESSSRALCGDPRPWMSCAA